MAITTQGVHLIYGGTGSTASWDFVKKALGTEPETYENLCIKDFPDLGNAQPDQVETTTLCDTEHQNIDGLGNVPDELSFTANFDDDFYDIIAGYSAEAHWGIQVGTGSGSPQWVFKATARIELVGAGVGDALEMRIVLTPKTEITKQNVA